VGNQQLAREFLVYSRGIALECFAYCRLFVAHFVAQTGYQGFAEICSAGQRGRLFPRDLNIRLEQVTCRVSGLPPCGRQILRSDTASTVRATSARREARRIRLRIRAHIGGQQKTSSGFCVQVVGRCPRSRRCCELQAYHKPRFLGELVKMKVCEAIGVSI